MRKKRKTWSQKKNWNSETLKQECGIFIDLTQDLKIMFSLAALIQCLGSTDSLGILALYLRILIFSLKILTSISGSTDSFGIMSVSGS